MLILFLFSVLWNHFLYAFENIEIPQIDAQITLYKAIYAEHNSPQFDPQMTHIQGYEKVLPMAFSYTRSLLEKAGVYETEKDLLMGFWEESQADMRTSKMTIARYKRTILRLSFLVSKNQPRGALHYGSLLFGNLYNNFLNQNYSLDYDSIPINGGFLKLPNIVDTHQFPFCFEALLFIEKGEFEYDDYLGALLDDDMTLSLSVFAASGHGPHNNLLGNSAAFLFHDLSHTGLFADTMTTDISLWPSIKRTFQGFYRENKKPKSLLFILLHELPQDIAKTMQVSDEELVSQFPIANLSSESYKILSCWFASSIKFLQIMNGRAQEDQSYIKNIIILPCSDDDFIIKIYSEKNLNIIYLNNPDNISKRYLVGSLYIEKEISGDEYAEVITVKNAKRATPAEELIPRWLKRLAKFDLNFEQLDTLMQKKLENYYEVFLTQKFIHDTLFYDLVPLTNQALDREALTPQSSREQIIEVWQELAQEFLGPKE